MIQLSLENDQNAHLWQKINAHIRRIHLEKGFKACMMQA